MPEDWIPRPPDDLAERVEVETWEVGRTLERVHNIAYAPNAYRPDPPLEILGRFHFFEDPAGRVVPALYGGQALNVALMETVFRSIGREPEARVIFRSSLLGLGWSTLAPSRPLRLARLYGTGLRGFGNTARSLTDTPPTDYHRTVKWAQAIYAVRDDIDGLVWMSRQLNHERAAMVFRDRLPTRGLEVRQMPVSLAVGPGFRKVRRFASAFGVTVL